MRAIPLIVAATGALASACATSAPPPAEIAEILWVPAEAQLEEDVARPVKLQKGGSFYIDGSAAVVFSIDSDGAELSSRIVAHVPSLGGSWRQRRTQYLNPQLATSFERGWQVHGGGLLAGEVSEALGRGRYQRWHGEWEDEGGSILVYQLGGQGRQLRGVASYVPRAVVEQTLGRMRR